MPFVSNDTSGCLVSDAGPGIIWSNSANVKVADAVYATCSLFPSGTSRPLGLSNLDMNVPGGATIVGFEPFVYGHGSATSAVLVSHCQVFMDDGTASSELAASEALPTSDGFVTYGGPTNLCGVNPTHVTLSNVNGFSFNIEFQFTGGGSGGTASIDRIGINVYYTTSGVGGGFIGSAAIMMHL